MKLKRLILQGFKSFKDRTTIYFDHGITGIVGPNGCGKSNVVDALFWVMGEQSAKHLRGASMKDLIFAGSSKYNPAAWAEVTLVLENTEGKHIHIGGKVASPTEIQISRKLYRNSETEYRINDSPCRLKDIQEVFMDTGAGAKSYSIIAQGEINRLVQAKPEERRVMIEEVAGITKFKLRKRDSLKKIEQTEANLGRLSDLQAEIEKNLKALQKQAERAEKARSLKERVKKYDLVVNSHKVFDLLRDFKDFNRQVDERSIDIEGFQTKKQTLEIDLEDERIKKEELIERIDELQKKYNEISRQLAGSEERLNYLCKGQTEKEKQIIDKEKELLDLKEELVHRAKRLDELLEKRDELSHQEEEGQDFSALEAAVEELKEQLDLRKEKEQDIQAELDESRIGLQEVDQLIFKNNSRLEEYAGSLQDLTTEIEALETQFSSVSNETAKERELVKNLEAKVDELFQAEQSLKASLEQNRQEYKVKSQHLKENTRNFIQIESRLNSLREVNNSLEGSQAGVGEFLDKYNSDGDFEVLGNLIRCDEKYTVAIQRLLGEYLGAIIGKEPKLSVVKDWLLDEKNKGIELISPNNDTLNKNISDDETMQRLEILGFKNIVPVNLVVEFKNEFKAIGTSLFCGFYLVEEFDLDAFNEIPGEINFKGLASLDGKFAVKKADGFKMLCMGRETDEVHGRIGRNNKIEQLDKELIEINQVVKKAEESVLTIDLEIERVSSDYHVMQERYSEVKSEYAAKKSALESKLSNMETGHSRLEILKNRKNEISKSRLQLLEKEESINIEQNNFNAQIEAKQEQLESILDGLDDIRASYEEKREELIQKEVEARSFQERFDSIASQVSDTSEQVKRLQARETGTIDNIERLKLDIEAVEVELIGLEQKNQEMAKGLTDQEEVLSLHKDELGQLLQGMQEREDEVKVLATKTNRFEKEIVEKRAKLEQMSIEEEQVTRDIFEKYQVDLRDVLGTFLEYTPEDFLVLRNLESMYYMESENGQVKIESTEHHFTRRYGQDLKDCAFKLKQARQELGHLGEINWQAIEDYERQKLRFDFLKIQEEELKHSLNDLETAIAHIDEKSKLRFKIAFDEVNIRFQKVFPIIFGGGNARLDVKGDINDAECGVDIIAQPPGKKMQNINLMSGGEKALTAVSLIFSIFLVKPSPFCLLDEVDAPLDDANVGRFNELLREMSSDSQFILITHNKKTMELNDTLYGVTMQEPGISKAVSVQLH